MLFETSFIIAYVHYNNECVIKMKEIKCIKKVQRSGKLIIQYL